MTVFTRTWNGAYVAAPADTDLRSGGAAQIRDLKTDIQERVVVDHSFGGDSNDGLHLHCTFMTKLIDPAPDSLHGQLYTKNVAGIVQLFYMDQTGVITQLTG